MTKQETTILKGVAILMMLCLHLFNTDFKISLCQIGIDVAGKPFLSFLMRAVNPVAFFLLFSGYGLYISYCNGKRNNGKRILKLYIHYWLTLVLFVMVGCFVVGKGAYPGTWQKVLENVTAWHTTYNGEIWFLFPYCLVAITSSFIFKVVDRVNLWVVFVGIGFIHLGTYAAVAMFGVSYFYSHRLAYMPIIYLSFFFPFVIGTLMAKYRIVNECKIRGG